MTAIRRCAVLLPMGLLILVGFVPVRAFQFQPSELHPQRPLSYLEVGEVRAARAETDAERSLARQVLAMGIVLGSQAGDNSVASSCAIALAQIPGDDQTGRLLWDLALLLDPGRVSSWVQHRAVAVDAPENRVAGDCVYFARQGEGDDANALYSQRPIRALIRETAEKLGINPADVHTTINTLIAHAREDSCRGRVFVSRVVDGESIRFVCPDHQRPIGTAPSDEALLDLLAIELHLMGESGMLRSWGGTAMMRLDTPARDPSVSDIAQWFGIDPARPYLVNGRWSETPLP